MYLPAVLRSSLRLLLLQVLRLPAGPGEGPDLSHRLRHSGAFLRNQNWI